MTIEEWVNILKEIENGNEVMFPFQLHRGVHVLIEAFGSIQETREFFENVRDAEPPEIKE